jgi:anti-sigma regulatory factor (Ser/Thr protein kinase)
MSFRCVFIIRSDTRYLGSLRQWIESTSELVGPEGFPAKAVAACSLALIEAVDNAIFHAHDRNADLPIEVSMIVSSSTVLVDVIDMGGGIGEFRTPDVAPDAMATSGRGLFLIKSLMSSVEHFLKDGKHYTRMIYKL